MIHRFLCVFFGYLKKRGANIFFPENSLAKGHANFFLGCNSGVDTMRSCRNMSSFDLVFACCEEHVSSADV